MNADSASAPEPRACNCGRMYWIVIALAFIFIVPILFAFWHAQ